VGTKEKIVYVLYVIGTSCKRCRNLGHTFLLSKDLDNMRVNGLMILVANTRLGIIP